MKFYIRTHLNRYVYHIVRAMETRHLEPTISEWSDSQSAEGRLQDNTVSATREKKTGSVLVWRES